MAASFLAGNKARHIYVLLDIMAWNLTTIENLGLENAYGILLRPSCHAITERRTFIPCNPEPEPPQMRWHFIPSVGGLFHLSNFKISSYSGIGLFPSLVAGFENRSGRF